MTLTENQSLAPSIFAERLQKEAGFPLNKVLRIFKDRNGTLWFTGTTGLVNYDGSNYIYYNSDPHSQTQSPAGWVESIDQDDNGRIWIGTVSGLYYLNPREKRFIPVTHAIPENARVKKREITSVYFDPPTRTLFYSSYYGLHALQLNSGKKSFLNFYGNRDDYHKIVQVGRGPDGLLYFSALFDGFHRLDPVTMKNYPIRFFEKGKERKDLHCIGLKNDINQKMWINTWGDGLLRVNNIQNDQFDITSYKWFHQPGDRFMHNIVNQFVSFQTSDKQFNIALATEDNGLMLLNPDNGQFTSFFHDPGNPHSIPDNSLTCILFDGHVLWAGSFNGAVKIAMPKQQFRKYTLNHNGAGSFGRLAQLVASDMCSDPLHTGIHWLTATNGKLGRIDSLNRLITWFYPDLLLRDPNSVIMRAVHSVNHHTLLIGLENGLMTFDIQTRTFARVFDSGNTAIWGSITSIESLDDQFLIITAFGQGVFKYEKKTGRIENFLPTKITERRIRFCKKISQNRLLITTMSDGFMILDQKTGKLSHYNVREKGKYHYPFAGLYNAAEDHTGALWLASADGLTRLDPKTKKISIFNDNAGFPDDWVLKVEYGTDRNIWVLTRNGLGRINPNNLRVQIFRYNQGFDDLKLTDLNASDDGYLWISGINKVYGFDPLALQFPKFNPELNVLSLRVNGKNFTLPDYQRVEFKPGLMLLEWNFSTTYFIDPEQIRYHIKLIGNGDTLIYQSHRLMLSFLPPGKYKIQAKAFHANRLWVSKSLVIPFRIKAYWYQTPAFYIMLAMIVVFIIWAIFRYRLYLLKKRSLIQIETERKINAMEMKTLRAQINPHFIFNSLNSIQRFVLSNDVLKASDYIGKFSRMIRMVLENSIENNTTLEMEKSLLQYYLDLEQMRTGERFTYEINIDTGIDPEIYIPSMLAQPYLENSIWHGLSHKMENGHIKVSFNIHPKGLCCKIEDNGIGRQASANLKKSESHKSRGLSITEQRLKIAFPEEEQLIVIEDILNEHGQVSGTRVQIIIPVYENKMHSR